MPAATHVCCNRLIKRDRLPMPTRLVIIRDKQPPSPEYPHCKRAITPSDEDTCDAV